MNTFLVTIDDFNDENFDINQTFWYFIKEKLPNYPLNQGMCFEMLDYLKENGIMMIAEKNGRLWYK